MSDFQVSDVIADKAIPEGDHMKRIIDESLKNVQDIVNGDPPPVTISRSQYSWNVFRYAGDYLHLGGVLIFFATVFKNKSVEGFSLKTQALYFLIFCTRYLDLFDHRQNTYLTVFKITYILSSGIALLLFWKMFETYEGSKDTASMIMITIPCLIATLILTNEYSLLELAWTYSEFLEGFSMVPQYVFSYRDGANKDKGVLAFIFCFGSYRVFYAMNWIYKKIFVPHYSDIQSWIGGIVEILFFLDFLNYRLRGSSILRSMVLRVDDKINEVQEKVELKVLGRSRDSDTRNVRKRKVQKEEETELVDSEV